MGHRNLRDWVRGSSYRQIGRAAEAGRRPAGSDGHVQDPLQPAVQERFFPQGRLGSGSPGAANSRGLSSESGPTGPAPSVKIAICAPMYERMKRDLDVGERVVLGGAPVL
jgi:hypothetical protein